MPRVSRAAAARTNAAAIRSPAPCGNAWRIRRVSRANAPPMAAPTNGAHTIAAPAVRRSVRPVGSGSTVNVVRASRNPCQGARSAGGLLVTDTGLLEGRHREGGGCALQQRYGQQRARTLAEPQPEVEQG